jgi:hypothetical protein
VQLTLLRRLLLLLPPPLHVVFEAHLVNSARVGSSTEGSIPIGR